MTTPEYGRLCVCGHQRRQHAHNRDLHDGRCSGSGCICEWFVDADTSETPIVQHREKDEYGE